MRHGVTREGGIVDRSPVGETDRPLTGTVVPLPPSTVPSTSVPRPPETPVRVKLRRELKEGEPPGIQGALVPQLLRVPPRPRDQVENSPGPEVDPVVTRRSARGDSELQLPPRGLEIPCSLADPGGPDQSPSKGWFRSVPEARHTTLGTEGEPESNK